jgi:fatty acid desaturase
MATFRIAAGRVLRYPAWDGLFVALSIAHGAVLGLTPAAPVVAVLLWWNANTISHNFIHRPFFGTSSANRVYSAYLTLVLGFPQTLWRKRHLQHHAELTKDAHAAAKPAAAYMGELLLLAAFWTLLAIEARPGLGDRTGSLPAAGLLRARARHPKPLRPPLQLPLLQ